MKYILYTFTLFSVIYLYGCGNDTPTNTGNGNGNETVIFFLDSLSINLNGSIAVKDTDIVITDASNIKITFNCSTNADSVNSFAFFRIIAGDSSTVYKDSLNNNISTLNTNHLINISASSLFTLKILVQLSRSNSSPYFIRLENVKIFKLL